MPSDEACQVEQETRRDQQEIKKVGLTRFCGQRLKHHSATAESDSYCAGLR